MDGRRAAGLLCGVFFASGASAVAFETLWFRQAGLAFGNSVWATSLVLAAFMAGLALGNAMAARWADRFAKPLGAYALMEVAVGASGVALVVLLPLLAGVFAPVFRPILDRPLLLNPLRLGLAFALLLAPSTAMGMTLPVLARVLGSWGEGFGKGLGRLYGWNTLGAVTGALLTEGALLRALGVRGTALAAAALNLACALAALWLSGRMAGRVEPRMPAPAPGALRYSGMRWLAAAALAGGLLLALEVVWFRFLALYVLGYAISFAVMLAVVLAGIGLGGLAGSRLLASDPSAHRHAGAVALLAGTLVALAYAAFPLAAEPLRAYPVKALHHLLTLGLPLMFPTCFLSGLLFTLCGAGVRDASPSDGSAVGRLTLWNTSGAALGAFAGGFLLLPGLGVERSLFALAALYGVAGALLLVRRPVSWKGAALPAAAFALSLALFPWGEMARRHVPNAALRWAGGSDTRIVAVREGLCETVVAVEVRSMGAPYYRRLVTNSYSMSANEFRPRRYMDLFVKLPQALHPGVRRALLVSFGVGVTARALADLPQAERIDVVDISPDILKMSPLFSPPGRDPLADPRVRVHVEDGRFFLQTAAERYDLITGEPPPPQMAGVVNLYTREYFTLIRERLSEGGIATYWLPMHSLGEGSAKAVIGAFLAVFPDATLWAGSGMDLILMGSRGGASATTPEMLARPFAAGGVQEMTSIGVEEPRQLAALFVGDSEFLGRVARGTPPLVDDYPKRLDGLPPPGPPPPLHRAFLDAGQARSRFGASPWVRTVLPPGVISATGPAFEVQGLLNALLAPPAPRRFFDPAVLHALLTRTALRAPVLWYLGSNAGLQAAARSAGWTDSPDPEVRYHASVGLLSERRYGEALDSLDAAAGSRPRAAWATALKVFALAESGRTDEARDACQKAADAGIGLPPGYWERLRDALWPAAAAGTVAP